MDKYVLITGAAGGIGAAIAKKYASEGNNVVLVDINEEQMQEIKVSLEKEYRVKCLAIKANLFDDASANYIYNSCIENGAEVQVLVNNAGIGASGDYDKSDWKRQKGIIDLDIIALMHLTRIFLPDMVKRHSGQIINIASNAGFIPLAPQPTYAAAKAFVISWTQALYESYYKQGVVFTVICPGPTKTNFFKEANFDLKNLKGTTPEKLAEFVYKKGTKKVAMASHGFKTKAMGVGARLFPRAWARKVAAKVGASK